MAIVTRADSFTESTKKIEFFSDFVDSFAKSPFGNQLGRVTNEKAVNQSLKNLIMTNLGERPFQPYIGSDVMATLFENNTYEALTTLQLYVQNCIQNNEPRVNLIDVQIYSDPYNENEVEVTIIYNLINNPSPINFTLLLKRVR
jgi:phage baseplate assembly protein W